MAGAMNIACEPERLYDQVKELVEDSIYLMEVCGTHTMAICRSGIRSRLPEELHLISGPGCPACVTPRRTIDTAVAMSREPGVTLLTFGDMMRVPGSECSLDSERATGADIRVVYSPFDGLRMASREPRRLFVLLGIGFETTSPSFAATLVRCLESSVENLLVLPAFKLVPPAMVFLIRSGRARIDGFLCPGHVSAVIGARPYEPLAEGMRVPCVISGFEPTDILDAIIRLLRQIAAGKPRVEIQYSRAVPRDGNVTALALAERVFHRDDSDWRGIGSIPGSGLELNGSFAAFDARRRLLVDVPAAPELDEGCACGDVMSGLLAPDDCPLFGGRCVPSNPVGPCMVSSEGVCAAYYRYGS
jgi:hydrogenase expression/formation protein HypD